MDKKTFSERTSTGKTLWHLLASNGNERLLALLLDWFDMKFGHGDLKAQLNALTSDDGKTGRSVLDDATWHRSCYNLVKMKGGVNVHWRYRVTNPGERVQPGHNLHRDTAVARPLASYRP